jgi:hypothetical protein
MLRLNEHSLKGKMSMTALIEERLPDVSAEQRAADESVKLVRKLRWMGMESEVNLREAKQREGSADCGMPPATQAHVFIFSSAMAVLVATPSASLHDFRDRVIDCVI